MNQNDIIYEFEEGIVVKDECECKKGCIRYSDCTFLPVEKIRHPEKLISYQRCWEVINELRYVTLCINTDTYPHAVGMNHIVLDGHIYFHCAQKGYKLKGLDHKVNYNLIQDLGINTEIGTHNHRSVSVYGILKEVKDLSIKKDVLLKLIEGTKHPYHDRMLQTTKILEIEIDFIQGKEHIY